MRLEVDEEVALRGTVRSRRVIRPRSGGQPFVKLTLTTEEGRDVQVVFWDAGRAPRSGEVGAVRGRVREYAGSREVHANQWFAEEGGLPDDPVARLVGFYIGCVEAEAAGSVRVRPGGSGHLELGSGPSPVFGRREIGSDRHVAEWCHQRQMGIGETVLAGWPMVVGPDPEGSSSGLVASPLLVVEAQLTQGQGVWSVEPDVGAVDLNPYALDLLGVDRQERDELVRLVEDSTMVEEAPNAVEHALAMLDVLRVAGLVELEGLDGSRLRSCVESAGVHNTGLLMVSRGSTRITRMLLEDLEELKNNSELVSTGPAAVLLGLETTQTVPLPSAHPTIALSTLSQDQAVTAAMENTFTVVTGPPGTGKSQVLVNVIAAAVARGEKVLFASKNNKAVDVVFERLALASPHATVIRAGASSRRSDVASRIAQILSEPHRTVSPTDAEREWRAVAAEVDSIHGVLVRRAQLEGRAQTIRSEIEALVALLPDGSALSADPEELDEAREAVLEALDRFGDRLGIFRRWKKHAERLNLAREAMDALGELLGLDHWQREAPLRSVVGKPRRTMSPRSDFAAIDDLIGTVLSVKANEKALDTVSQALAGLPSRYDLDEALHEIGPRRVEAGRKLVDARWEQLRRDNPAARTAAGRLAETLEEIVSRGSGARRARGIVKSALAAIPVWGVTNLSARTNLPLDRGLFDLVVIDEASQCDVASALPLLARGNRAMIVGDRRQLIHITSLGRAREHRIADRWGLDHDQVDEFSYRKRSCFGLAASRVAEAPVFLDLHFRSHPAIIGFSNTEFYGGRLELCSDSRPPNDLPAVEWVRVSGDSRRGPRGRSQVNHEEARAVSRLVAEEVTKLSGLGLTSGVVTPYRAQAELITKNLAGTLDESVRRQITVSTAHGFQGDERDLIFFSPVVGPSMSSRQVQFAADPNLVNVALTRARRRLVVVGNIEACLGHHNVLSDLAKYVARLEAGGFDSPLELMLHEALLAAGVPAETGVLVSGQRLDLAVEFGGTRLDIECDGAPFHADRRTDLSRDRKIEAAGWRVVRFSGRRLSRNLDSCVGEILAIIR